MEQRLNILLIESDARRQAELISRISDAPRYPCSFFVDASSSFAQGLQDLGRKSYDVLVLDLDLSDSQGLDGFYSLRAVAARVPIIVLTEHGDMETAKRALAAGASDFVLSDELTDGVLQRSIYHSVLRFEMKHKFESALEAAERAQRAKSDVLMNLSSEIHAPLYSAIRMTELVLGTRLANDQREYLESVSNSAYTLLTLVNDILDFSRIESGVIDLEAVNFKLREYISQVTGLLTDRARKKDIQLSFSIEDDVPNRLRGDIDRLGQVIKNFIGNSITYARYGGQIMIGVSAEEQTEKGLLLHFAINLRGADIPLEKQKLIFESFAQADASTARKYGSMGLGLAVSSRLIKMMGGKVWVEHETDQGITFHFTAQFLIDDREPSGTIVREPPDQPGASSESASSVDLLSEK